MAWDADDYPEEWSAEIDLPDTAGGVRAEITVTAGTTVAYYHASVVVE